MVIGASPDHFSQRITLAVRHLPEILDREVRIGVRKGTPRFRLMFGLALLGIVMCISKLGGHFRCLTIEGTPHAPLRKCC